MLTKQKLAEQFSKEWKKHYSVQLFQEEGFQRKKCIKCGKNFWTLDQDRVQCADSNCEPYNFIGSPITKQKYDYIEMWKAFEKFFMKHGHTSIPRYPVVDRWRPDLYFNIASIQAFQRIDNGQVVMEWPADPLVVPQVCLRFVDIPNVGVTGRHHTSFIMSGQHSFGKYWKDECISLNFEFLSRVLGIPKEKLIYGEDIWGMPDLSQFGPCLETQSLGLELVNSVFNEYTASGDSYKKLPQRVIDVGWGHERLVWFSQGTTTGYEAVFGPVIDFMLSETGVKMAKEFREFSRLSGSLDVDEVGSIKEAKKLVAKQLGIDTKALNETVEPLQALFAIADHTKTLLFALTDGMLPSNVGGGYNLRVLLRRALSFQKEFDFNLDLIKVSEMHSRFLKPLFPDLKEGLPIFQKVLDIENTRYSETLKRGESIVLSTKELTTPKLVELYISHGITPEMVEEIRKKQGKEFVVPEDFYPRLTEEHSKGKKITEKAELNIDITGMPPTEQLYYKEEKARRFEATIIGMDKEWIILDKTLFYPQGGGQPADHGTLTASQSLSLESASLLYERCRDVSCLFIQNETGKKGLGVTPKKLPYLHVNQSRQIHSQSFDVKDVQKIGDVILHKVDKPGLKIGQKVKGEIDWETRMSHMRAHTGTHVVISSTRKAIGPHIWQAGAQKTEDGGRIDVTHYQRFTLDELKEIEKLSNQAIKKGLEVKKTVLDRARAEKEYGFTIYQGGASPGKKIRIVSIGDQDTQACGGTHLDNTKEIGTIKITHSERIQDGVNRIEFVTGPRAQEFLSRQKEDFNKVLSSLKKISPKISIPFNEWDTKSASQELSVDTPQLPATVEKFCSDIMEAKQELESLGAGSSLRLVQEKTLQEAARSLFILWKKSKKEMELAIDGFATKKLPELLKKARNNTIKEIIPLSRQGLIRLGEYLLQKDGKLTVILANKEGDIVIMSQTQDAGKIAKDLASKSGGSGGGTPRLGQGKGEPEKVERLLKL